ncbi:MAG: transcriptional regulator [Clostridiales bacterium 43-6]|nr:MAG: transcriptional regulator [Clostridiales bacterium 43-6]
MENRSDALEAQLICIIVNYGTGSKIIKKAKQLGISGATVTLGKGTVQNRALDFLGLTDMRKEIIFLVAEKDAAIHAIDEISKEFEFSKPNHGIAYTASVCGVAGTKRIACTNNMEERGGNNTMYHIITVIVDKGKAEDAITAATKAGSKGGTIMNARGSGIHETSKVFSMEIEPEKEIVIILSEVEKTEAIVSSIRTDLKLDEPGNGIVYVQNASNTYGLYK